MPATKLWPQARVHPKRLLLGNYPSNSCDSDSIVVIGIWDYIRFIVIEAPAVAISIQFIPCFGKPPLSVLLHDLALGFDVFKGGGHLIVVALLARRYQAQRVPANAREGLTP